MKRARLIFTTDCNRNCKGCCNKNWKYAPPRDISFDELLTYNEIIITGGEPMLYINELTTLIRRLKAHDKRIIVYTAMPKSYEIFNSILQLIDGITLTIHTKNDFKTFISMGLDKINIIDKSLRLNVFPNIELINDNWSIKKLVWIKDCPLPSGEELVKLTKAN